MSVFGQSTTKRPRMKGWHRRSSSHPATSSNTGDRVPERAPGIGNSGQQQLERQFRHGLLTALEALPKLILPCP
jgi:hypothetical protein